MASGSKLAQLVKNNQEGILRDWMDEQLSDPNLRKDLIREGELKKESINFLNYFSAALDQGDLDNIQAPSWSATKEMLSGLSRTRGEMGFSPSETATFVCFKFTLPKAIETPELAAR